MLMPHTVSLNQKVSSLSPGLCHCALSLWRQHGGKVRALDLKSESPGFKSRSRWSCFLVDPSSTPWPRL